MSNKNFHKPKIIYKRLKESLGEGATWSDLGNKLGISRQAVNDRKNKDTVDYEDIERAFPDINKDWLYADSYEDLMLLPVKKSFTNDATIEEKIQEYSTRKANGSVSENERDLLLQFLLDHAESVSEGLRRLIEIERNRSGE